MKPTEDEITKDNPLVYIYRKGNEFTLEQVIEKTLKDYPTLKLDRQFPMPAIDGTWIIFIPKEDE